MAESDLNHSANLTPLPRLPEADPPEELGSLAREYPALILLGGFALGIAVGALLPRMSGRKFAERAATFASGASEAGMLLSRLALDRADSATRESREKIAEGAAEAGKWAAEAARETREAGACVIRKAVKGVRNIRS